MKLIFHDNNFQVIPEGVEWHEKPKVSDYPDTWIGSQNFHNQIDAYNFIVSQLIQIREEDQEKVKRMCYGTFFGPSDYETWQPIPDHVYEVEVKMELEKRWFDKNGDELICNVNFLVDEKKTTKQYRLINQEKEHPKPRGTESDRDWQEDYEQENGNYQNKCVYCNELFYGNKHRVVCKCCDNRIASLEAELAEAKKEIERLKIK